MEFNYLNSPEDVLRMITRTFFSDLHIIIIELILRENYVTEYSISTELKLGLNRIRLITNNLINEKLINYEERLFKNLRVKNKFDKVIYKRNFKQRYLYFDKIFFSYNIKKKFKKVLSESLKEKKKNLNSFLICPRKICKKIYEKKDIKNISIDNEKGGFICTNPLSFNILCGSKLIEEERSSEIKTDGFRKIKFLIDSIHISNLSGKTL
jgi:transcription initiation factor IIE alpha subunit